MTGDNTLAAAMVYSRKRDRGKRARRNRAVARHLLSRMSLLSRIRFVIWGI